MKESTPDCQGDLCSSVGREGVVKRMNGGPLSLGTLGMQPACPQLAGSFEMAVQTQAVHSMTGTRWHATSAGLMASPPNLLWGL